MTLNMTYKSNNSMQHNLITQHLKLQGNTTNSETKTIPATSKFKAKFLIIETKFTTKLQYSKASHLL